MVPNLNELRLAEERQRELRREADLLRYKAEVTVALRVVRPPRQPIYASALARLGRLLSAWGARLQAIEARR